MLQHPDRGGNNVGNIVLMMSVSADGFIEGPDRDIGWHRVDDELHRDLNEVLAEMGAFLSGRVTYELMAGFWPTANSDPASTPPMVEFAGIWRDTPKVVYSRTLERAGWNTTIVREVDPAKVRRLACRDRRRPRPERGDLAAAFRRHDLIDEYRILVHPVAIGRGKPLFEPVDTRTDLRLVATRTFGNEVVLLHHRRA
jgi:dihydrofolate reductase